MSRCKNKKRKREQKKKKLFLLLLAFVVVFFCSIIVYGDNVFYTMKTFLYENKASEVKIKTDKNDDLENINLHFFNEGSCDVYLRCFVFVYPKNEGNIGTILSNSSVKFNYGDENYWFVGEDNYIYYTKPLKIGSKTEKPMVESINIDLSEDDERLLEGCELGIDIVTEAVQVNNFAYKYEWDMENMNLENLYNSDEFSESKEIDNEKIIKLKFQ